MHKHGQWNNIRGETSETDEESEEPADGLIERDFGTRGSVLQGGSRDFVSQGSAGTTQENRCCERAAGVSPNGMVHGFP